MERESTDWKKLKEIHQPIIICEPYLEPDSNKEAVKKTKIDDIYENWNSEHLLMIVCNFYQFLQSIIIVLELHIFKKSFTF